MPQVTIGLRNVDGTEAAMGRAGSHAIVDRPEGTAGGRGLGFNCARLMALGDFAVTIRAR